MSQERFIDKALEHLRVCDPNHPSIRRAHKLQIESLKNGKAHCSCGGWYYSHTGTVVYEEVFEEFEKHLGEPKIVIGDGNLRHS